MNHSVGFPVGDVHLSIRFDASGGQRPYKLTYLQENVSRGGQHYRTLDELVAAAEAEIGDAIRESVRERTRGLLYQMSDKRAGDPVPRLKALVKETFPQEAEAA